MVPWSQRLSCILYWQILWREPLLLIFFTGTKRWEPRKESLWSRPLGTSLSCHQLLTVVSDWRIFLIAPRVIGLDLWTNCKSDPLLWLVKRKWHLWQLSSAEPAWKWDSQRPWPEVFFSLGLGASISASRRKLPNKKDRIKESLWDQGTKMAAWVENKM